MTRNGKITFTLCAYEATALVSRGKLATLTSMQRRCPVLGAVLVGALAGHFMANNSTACSRRLRWLK
jgi:hypothetical protein